MNDSLTIESNVSLLPYNTFGIDVKASRLAIVGADDGNNPIDRYSKPIEKLRSDGCFESRYFVLGGGSNVVFTRDFAGTVVMMSRGKVAVDRVDGDTVYVSADAGMTLDDVVSWCVAKDLYGLENLSAIPGTVGASVVQNVGAYGAEAKDYVDSVCVYDIQDNGFKCLTPEECEFGYRSSMFKRFPGRYLVLNVIYRLSRTFVPNLGYKALENMPHSSAKELRDAITDLRWSKLPRPAEHGSAGSFFKNPIVDEATCRRLLEKYPNMPHYPGNKLSAGWLIDQCGWKGKRIGRVGVWPNQALVLYNAGGCTGQEVREVAEIIRTDVASTFGVELECEAIFVD